MAYLLPTIGILFIFLMLAAFFFFDRILKIQYTQFKGEWEKAGAPHGFFWLPKESLGKIKVLPNSASTRSRTKHFFSWIFRTPEWVGQNPAAKANLFKVRALFVISLTLLVSFGILYIAR